MPEVMTRADSLRRYLTGAASDGGAQSNPDASFGNYRSSTQLVEMDHVVTSPISDITVDFVSANNGTGAGTLTASGSDELKWTPPGASQGVGVTIANGETKVLEGGGAPEKFIIVSRTSATALTGAATVTISQAFNKLYDDVASTEQTSGDDEYRCEMHKNGSASQITNLKVWIGTLGTDQTSDNGQLGASGLGTIVTSGSFSDWPSSGFVAIYNGSSLREIAYYTGITGGNTLNIPAAGRGALGTSAAAGAATDTVKAVPGIRIAKEDPSAQPSGFVQTIADESTAPTSVSWVTPHTAATGINVGTLAAGNIYGLWIHREVIAGATSESEVVNRIMTSYDAA